MQFGLIGAGAMGRYQAARLARVPGARLVAIGDAEPAPAAQDLAEQLGAELVGSAEAVLRRADVEAVLIATPTSTHAELAIAAARAGKHILCEKPIARSLDEAEAMIAAADRAGVRLAVGHVVRYFQGYAAAREMILRGEIGTPGIARATRLTAQPRSPWYRDAEQSGGVVLDVMIHDFDWMRWTFGPVERLHAVGLPGGDAAMVVLRFASGAIGYVEGSWRYREFRTDLEVSGSGGLIQLDNRGTATSHFDLELPEAVRAAYPDGLEEGPYEAQIREVAAWMAGGQAPRHSAEEAREALRIGLAAVESLRSGRPVTL